MRDTIAGAVLAIVFLALLFAAPRMLPRGIEGATHEDLAQISTGFSGTKVLGSWTLRCSGGPAANSAGHGAPASPKDQIGRCRMARGYRDGNGRLVLAVAFRYAGPARALTMIVQYPPVGSKGQFLVIALNQKASLRLPVFGCAKNSCVAVGALIPAAQSLLLAAPQAKVVLPPMADGKQYTIAIRLDGLGQALEGMHRAEL